MLGQILAANNTDYYYYQRCLDCAKYDNFQQHIANKIFK